MVIVGWTGSRTLSPAFAPLVGAWRFVPSVRASFFS